MEHGQLLLSYFFVADEEGGGVFELGCGNSGDLGVEDGCDASTSSDSYKCNMRHALLQLSPYLAADEEGDGVFELGCRKYSDLGVEDGCETCDAST